MGESALFVTGGTGLIGRRTLACLLGREPDLRAYVLVRDRARWQRVAEAERLPVDRLTPLMGDVTRPGLALSEADRRTLERETSTVLHCAGDTVFSNPLDVARRTNTLGTEHLLDLVGDWPGVERLVHVSTAFVAGRRTGRIRERWYDASEGFVNFYEQSKHEGEALVRASGTPWVVVRPSTVVCDSADGVVSQFNAVHRSLRLYHSGLAPMLPGSESTPVDLITTRYVAECVSTICRAPDVEGDTFHVCAGDGAIELGTLLDVARAVWAESDEWRRKSIARPALTEIETYRLFERTVDETADARLRSITRSLAHFVPQLSLAKTFDVTHTVDLTGSPPAPVSSFWEPTVRHLGETRWAATVRAAT